MRRDGRQIAPTDQAEFPARFGEPVTAQERTVERLRTFARSGLGLSQTPRMRYTMPSGFTHRASERQSRKGINGMARVSVLICCANMGQTLEAACRSVDWADELVIVDSGSRDNTAEVAQQYASRYVTEPWRGYTEQLSYGTTLCRNDWVLVLDGDEECSPELGREILNLTDDELARFDVLRINRRNYLFGRHVRAWDPDQQTRLLHRQRCRWRDEVLHYAAVPSDPARVRDLQGTIEHKRTSMAGFDDYFSGRRMDARLTMVAEEMHRHGKRAGWLQLMSRPLFAFIKFYFLKHGYRDGLFGFLIAQKAAVSVQLKYAALWAYQQQAHSSSALNPALEEENNRTAA